MSDFGPVQTSNFSCTEPNVVIKNMRRSTYESIRIDRFVFGSTVPIRLDSSRIERQKIDIDSDVELFMCHIQCIHYKCIR